MATKKQQKKLREKEKAANDAAQTATQAKADRRSAGSKEEEAKAKVEALTEAAAQAAKKVQVAEEVANEARKVAEAAKEDGDRTEPMMREDEDMYDLFYTCHLLDRMRCDAESLSQYYLNMECDRYTMYNKPDILWQSLKPSNPLYVKITLSQCKQKCAETVHCVH